MPSTRASARNGSSPHKEDTGAGSKRKADSSSLEGSRKAAKQTTIEESLAGTTAEDQTMNSADDAEMKGILTTDDSKIDGEDSARAEEGAKKEGTKRDETPNPAQNHAKGNRDEQADDKTENPGVKSDGDNVEAAETKIGDPVQESSQRERNIASNILEKGIVYFFTRNRVGIEDSESVGDLARTYFVLRPLPIGTKLGS